jgi:hypothetical protein
MQLGDRHSAVPRGRMLAKVRSICHVPGTNFAPILEPLGQCWPLADATWGQALGGA